MQTIVITSTLELWKEAGKSGQYTHSTIDTKLAEAGFIHATSPYQTIAMLNRYYPEREDIILLLADVAKIIPGVKFEASSSGRTPGQFPHIYGPLNINAVYKIITPLRDTAGDFVPITELSKLPL